MKRTLLALAMAAASTVAVAQNADLATNAVPGGVNHVPAEAYRAPANTLVYDNGSFVTGVGTGPGGSNLSALAAGENTLGAGANPAAVRLADNFTIPTGGANVQQAVVFCYQTGSTTTSTFNGGVVQLWNGQPGSGGTQFFGDTTTNRFASSQWSGVYRVGTTVDTARPVMATALNVGTLLAAGSNYWLDFGVTGTLASGPFCPSLNAAVAGQNGIQFTVASSTWAPVTDSGNARAIGFPFLIIGTGANALAAPVNSPLALLLMGLVMVGVGAFAVSRKL
jgi:hypothetical protein